MTDSERVKRMYADADKAEGRRTIHDPGEGLRGHMQRQGVSDRPPEEPLRRPETVAAAEGSPEAAEAPESPGEEPTGWRAELLASLKESWPCAACALPRKDHQDWVGWGEVLGVREHEYVPAENPPTATATINLPEPLMGDVLPATESGFTGIRTKTLADLKTQIEALREERARALHRRGTGPAYRQEGELNALDLVLTYIEQGTFTPGEPSITCPHCGRTSYNPNDIEQRYCGVCGYHDQPTKRGV